MEAPRQTEDLAQRPPAPKLVADAATVARALSRLDVRDGWCDAYFERRRVVEATFAGAEDEARDVRENCEQGLAVRLVHEGSWLASRDELSGEAFADACRQVARVAPRVPIRAPDELVAGWQESFPESLQRHSQPPGSTPTDLGVSSEADGSLVGDPATEMLDLREFPNLLREALAASRVAFAYTLRIRFFDHTSQVITDLFGSGVQRERYFSVEVRSERLRWGLIVSHLTPDVAQRAAFALASQFKVRDARTPRAGPTPVVFSPRATAVLLHEAIAHALEADHLALTGRPQAASGVELASDQVNVLEDPGTAPSGVTRSCDDEGMPVERRWLLREGVVVHPLSDRYWAKREEGLLPGAGWRGDRHQLPVPRSRHLEMLAGTSDVEGLLSVSRGGLYVDELSAGGFDPFSGRCWIEAPYARAIGASGLAERMAGCRLQGLLAEVLGGIELLGEERRSGSAGWCAKAAQRSPVWATAPMIAVTSGLVAEVGRR